MVKKKKIKHYQTGSLLPRPPDPQLLFPEVTAGTRFRCILPEVFHAHTNIWHTPKGEEYYLHCSASKKFTIYLVSFHISTYHLPHTS